MCVRGYIYIHICSMSIYIYIISYILVSYLLVGSLLQDSPWVKFSEAAYIDALHEEIRRGDPGSRS